MSCRSYFFAELMMPFVLGAAAIVFTFAAFGFLVSRLPRCSPLAMDRTPVAWTATPHPKPSATPTPTRERQLLRAAAVLSALQPATVRT